MRHNALSSLRSALLAAGFGASASTPAEAAGSAFPPGGAAIGPDQTTACSSVISQPECADIGASIHSCSEDSDCTERPFGKCVQGFGMIGAYCGCEYACEVDADCAMDEVCVCADQLAGHYLHSVCVPAECESNAECASGACDLSLYFNGCKQEAILACRTDNDECSTDSDCGEDSTCAFDHNMGAWTCQGIMCIIGRPLMVEGVARVAAPTTRDDWSFPAPALPTEPLSAPDAARLAAYWIEVAALEHASVASFARFTLELLALGAPPELVADAQRAAMDEVEHARFAWSQASAHAGRAIGPGPLRVDDIVPVRALAPMVASLVEEGCVGETLGAAEAELIAQAVAVPGLRAGLEKIADDEQRHAALAWRTLRWLVERHGDPVRQAALGALAAAARTLAADLAAASDEFSAPGFGVLSRTTLLAHRRDTLEQVVRPVLNAVLGP